ncbi:hypothetical protein WMY93_031551 [Mugilogobius chulae]|uniref:Elongation factor 1 beta central acidic region eukaryote domain-containing protein n=1 Tax=Mugilogobius chulae TaxID=88201 RepID=A0AAW0MG18_9GOBI
MGFGDLRSASGLKVLNDFLQDRSYIEGSSRPRQTWLCSTLSPQRPLLTCATPCAGTTTSSPTAARKTVQIQVLQQPEKQVGLDWFSPGLVQIQVLQQPEKQSSRGEEAVGSVRSSGRGRQHRLRPKAPAANKEEEEDDDLDLFGSDEEEDEEAARIKEERLAAYAAKKSKKPAVIAKSSILLDVKPWDDETDMKKMEECVRTIQMDGLVWGQCKTT